MAACAASEIGKKTHLTSLAAGSGRPAYEEHVYPPYNLPSQYPYLPDGDPAHSQPQRLNSTASTSVSDLPQYSSTSLFIRSPKVASLRDFRTLKIAAANNDVDRATLNAPRLRDIKNTQLPGAGNQLYRRKAALVLPVTRAIATSCSGSPSRHAGPPSPPSGTCHRGM